jgi:hypothetical protein
MLGHTVLRKLLRGGLDSENEGFEGLGSGVLCLKTPPGLDP